MLEGGCLPFTKDSQGIGIKSSRDMRTIEKENWSLIQGVYMACIECCYEIQMRNLTVTYTSVSTDWGIKQRSIGKELEPFKRPWFLIQP
jgi:hypothetical protein